MTVARKNRLLITVAGAVVAAGGLLSPAALLAQSSGTGNILFEAYRGTSRVPQSVINDNSRPKFNNRSPNIEALMTLHNSNDPLAVIRSGRESGLDWRQERGTHRLCDHDSTEAAVPTSQHCKDGVMGRVFYTVIRLPNAATYRLWVANDDDVQIDLSSDLGRGADYKNATWNIPVGRVGSYTSNQTRVVKLGDIVSPSRNSCMLLRGAWGNNGGRNYMRIGYRTDNTTPSSFSSLTPFPASDFIDPTNLSEINSKCENVVRASPTIELVKQLPDGRAQASDQFRLSLYNGTGSSATEIAGASTSGSSNTQSVVTHAIALTAGQTSVSNLSIGESAPTSVMQWYDRDAKCNVKNTVTGALTPLSLTYSSSTGRWNLPAIQHGQWVVCEITNSRRTSALELRKTSNASGTMRTGDTIQYTLVARNAGPVPANGSLVADPAVPGISCSGTVSCSATGGAVCPAEASRTVASLQGSGIPIATFPVGGQVTLVFDCTVTASGY